MPKVNVLVIVFILMSGCAGSSTGKFSGAEPKVRTGAGPQSETQLLAPEILTTAERLEKRALWFEGRGVLDRAAEFWIKSHEAESDVAKLQHAAELLDVTLDAWTAKKHYEELIKLGVQIENSTQILARLDKSIAQYDGDFNGDAHAQRETANAREAIRLGDFPGAVKHLTTTDLARRDSEALSLLGSVLWRLGDRKVAQKAWSQARARRDLTLSSASVVALPAFSFAPINFGITNDHIIFAASGGTALRYDQGLRTFNSLDFDIARLAEDFPRAKGEEFAQMWAFPYAKIPKEHGESVSAVAAPKERLVALRNEHDALSLFQLPEYGQAELLWTRVLKERVADEGRRNSRDPSESLGVCFSADHKGVFAGTHDGKIVSYDLKGKQLSGFKAHEGLITHLATSADGKWVVSAAKDDKLRIWDLASGKLEQELQGPSEVRDLYFFPDSNTVEVTDVWDLTRYEWKTKRVLMRHHQGVEFLRVQHSPNARWTALGHYKTRSLSLIDETQVRKEKAKKPHAKRVTTQEMNTSMVFGSHADLSADGERLATSTEKGVTLFDLASTSAWRITSKPARRGALSANGETLAVEHEDGVTVYDLSSLKAGGDPKKLSHIPFKGFGATQIAFVSDSELLISRAAAQIYDLPSGALQSREEGRRRFYALSEGAIEFTGSRRVRLNKSGQVVEELHTRHDLVAVSASRRHFAYVNLDGELVIRNVGGDEQSTLKLDGRISHLTLSADAKHVAVQLNSGELFVGFVESKQWLRRGEGEHKGLLGLDNLAFFGSEWLLTSGSDGVLAYHVQRLELRGGLHFLSNGSWFSVVNRSYSTFVDGDPGGVDASLPLHMPDTPGFVWEHLRREGSFAQLLFNQLPEDKSPM